MTDDILDKTLEQLDGQDWGEPNFDSYVVTNCHRLRRIPLRDFLIEDLRLMVGQGIGLNYLLPLVLPRLQENLLIEATFYPGDLLSAVLRQEETFWRENPVWYTEVRTIVNSLSKVPDEMKQEVRRFRRMQF